MGGGTTCLRQCFCQWLLVCTWVGHNAAQFTVVLRGWLDDLSSYSILFFRDIAKYISNFEARFQGVVYFIIIFNWNLGLFLYCRAWEITSGLNMKSVLFLISFIFTHRKFDNKSEYLLSRCILGHCWAGVCYWKPYSSWVTWEQAPGSCEEGTGDALIGDVLSSLIAELFCDPSLGLNKRIIDR